MVSDRHIKSLVEKGNDALRNQSWGEGSKIFNELCEIFPNNDSALINYSLCLIYCSEYTKAKEILDKVEKLTPLSIQVNHNRGICLYLERNLDQALEFFKKCLRIDKDHEDSWFMCGKISREKENYSDAIGIFQNMIKKNPRVDFLIELSLAHVGNNEFEQAENILKKILDFKPENKTAREILIKLYKNIPGKESLARKLEKDQ